MPNIMITETCNLNCTYCFANEFVNKTHQNMSFNEFIDAVEFLRTGHSKISFGIIGGEPTLHPEFKMIMKYIIDSDHISEVTLFTNGLLLEKFADELSHHKIKILINCNSPEDIGYENYAKYRRNIDYLINKRYCKDKITLGINMYKSDFDFSYILELLKEFRFNNLRVSVSVPNIDHGEIRNSLTDFLKIKPRIRQFFNELFILDVLPFFDCNFIPSCILNEEDLGLIKLFENKLNRKLNIYTSKCEPVIDITPGLKAVRCFGLSSHSKVDIKNFNNLEELKNHYFNSIDSYAYSTVLHQKCLNCTHRENYRCTNGCLVYKINQINAVKKNNDDFIERSLLFND